MKNPLNILLNIGEFIFAILCVAVFVLIPLTGYFAVTCPDHPFDWAFFILIFFPIMYPVIGFLLFIAIFALAFGLQPLHSKKKLLKLFTWGLPIAIGASLITAYLSHAMHITEHCSFGF
jgi:hypothetical protein